MDISSHLNNLGAAAAEEGRFNQAVDLLGKALDAKLATLAISDSGKSTQSRFVQASGLIQARASRNGKKNHESSFQSDFTSSGTFIYRRAFFIEIEERDEEDSVTRINNTTTVPPLCIIHSAILLYNLALIYHMKAGPKKHIHFLEKSSTLYRMALGLVKDVADSQSINLVDSRLVLAILNNLGEIYFEQIQFGVTTRL